MTTTTPDVRAWFFVSFDDASVRLDVKTDEPWRAEFRFDDIVRVCLKMEPDSFSGVSHGIYVWIAGRENSYAIPLDGTGGDALLSELTRRGLLPAELVIRAMGSTEGVFCWPP